MYNTIVRNIETDSKWDHLRPSLTNYTNIYLNSFTNRKDWKGLKNAVEESGSFDKASVASAYNNAAWRIQETGKDLELAEEFGNYASSYAKSEWQKPSSKKPVSITEKQWNKQRESSYGMYADTYAMVLFKLGKYKQGLLFAKDAVQITKGKSADYNGTYALLAEKALPSKLYKKELEQFVRNGKSTSEIKDILKRVYQKEHKDAEGFNTYIAALEKESYLKMLEELRKSMLSETAPAFALLDLEGKKVDITDLKGKVVVVDFWATWCGPCKASFPGMQKMVSKYKDNNNVKFIFIDTWEREENKEKNAADFIADNKYSFHVLMDNDNKVVEQFKVDGIPTKFVIDKDGLIRFKSVGFDGSDDKLVKELTAMIDMAGDPSKKAF
jgi:thiol-disulfide isomerase/thioredoxin